MAVEISVPQEPLTTRGKARNSFKISSQSQTTQLCSWQKQILQLLQKLKFEVFPCPDHPSGLHQEGNELFGSAASTALCFVSDIT